MNILEKANNIVYKRKEEKERQYGPFDDSLFKTAVIASQLCNKDLNTEDIYKVLIALKLSRMAYNHKEDTYLDMIAYITALFNHKNKNNEKTITKKQSKRAKSSKSKS
jgi:hypothetical protein